MSSAAFACACCRASPSEDLRSQVEPVPSLPYRVGRHPSVIRSGHASPRLPLQVGPTYLAARAEPNRGCPALPGAARRSRATRCRCCLTKPCQTYASRADPRLPRPASVFRDIRCRAHRSVAYPLLPCRDYPGRRRPKRLGPYHYCLDRPFLCVASDEHPVPCCRSKRRACVGRQSPPRLPCQSPSRRTRSSACSPVRVGHSVSGLSQAERGAGPIHVGHTRPVDSRPSNACLVCLAVFFRSLSSQSMPRRYCLADPLSLQTACSPLACTRDHDCRTESRRSPPSEPFVCCRATRRFRERRTHRGLSTSAESFPADLAHSLLRFLGLPRLPFPSNGAEPRAPVPGDCCLGCRSLASVSPPESSLPRLPSPSMVVRALPGAAVRRQPVLSSTSSTIPFNAPMRRSCS